MSGSPFPRGVAFMEEPPSHIGMGWFTGRHAALHCQEILPKFTDLASHSKVSLVQGKRLSPSDFALLGMPTTFTHLLNGLLCVRQYFTATLLKTPCRVKLG